MTWVLRFLDRRQAQILRFADNHPITGYIDWLTAQAVVDAHNKEIEALRGK
jgi:enhancing lycopene biosynthesis protein 2